MVNETPTHIGLIMDGNRRFAKSIGKSVLQGHEDGAKTMMNTMKWAKELGVKELTFYAFSTENFKRPKQEFDALMKLFAKIAQDLLDAVKKKAKDAKEKARIRFVGLIHLFPENVQELMRKVMDATKNFKDYVVNIAVGYGGRAEIVKAFKSLHNKVNSGDIDLDSIDEESISNELYVSNEPQIIIRTGGQKRLSNFLLWQSSYSELYFIDKMWPQFSKNDLKSCVEEYMGTKINVGA